MTDTQSTGTAGGKPRTRRLQTVFANLAWSSLILMLGLTTMITAVAITFYVDRKFFGPEHYRLILHKSGCMALNTAGIETRAIPDSTSEVCSATTGFSPANFIRSNAQIEFQRNGELRTVLISPREIISAEWLAKGVSQ